MHHHAQHSIFNAVSCVTFSAVMVAFCSIRLHSLESGQRTWTPVPLGLAKALVGPKCWWKLQASFLLLPFRMPHIMSQLRDKYVYYASLGSWL
jgi:hypothetical protein